MSSRTQVVIDRAKNRLNTIEWNLHDYARARENASYVLSLTWWQILRWPLGIIVFALAAAGGATAMLLSGIPENFTGAAYFLGGAGGLIGLIWLGCAVDERREAPQKLDYSIKQIGEYESEKLEVTADLERARKRQEILSSDTRWVGDQVKALAATAGWSDADINRLDNVFAAVSEDFRA